MAVYPIWPAGLPQRPQMDSYSFSPTDNAVSFQPSVGGVQRRARSLVETNDNQLTFLFDTNQLATFKHFYRTHIGMGALQFKMPDPISGQHKVFVMTGRYTLAPVSHNWYRVSFNVQEQPV